MKTDDSICIKPLNENESAARPSVWKEENSLHMIFTYRGVSDFRDGENSYRLGYAKCNLNKSGQWLRDDSEIRFSSNSEEYDKKMQTYPFVLKVAETGKTLLFYNGNSFGKNGICIGEVRYS